MHLQFNIETIDETISSDWKPTIADLYISEKLEIIEEQKVIKVSRVLTQQIENGTWVKSTEKYYPIALASQAFTGFDRQPNMQLFEKLFEVENYKIVAEKDYKNE